MPFSQLKPHIVWIILDTHRYDRLGAYGYPRSLSLNLDRFASQSILFERAIAPAQWTIPSHASMFTGEYPTTHLTTQSGDMLDGYFRTAAEWLQTAGYQTNGFCNNPLVGVINNGLKRGFNTFYNYGGAVPSTPARALHHPVKLLSQLWERYTQLLRRISYPVQNAIAKSEQLFNISLNPTLVPLWTRYAHFKGDTRRSLNDASAFIRQELTSRQAQPQFIFINLLETHFPLNAPEPFISKFAPILKEERAARDFMRVYNTQALRWLLPMEEPFSPLESQAISESYDAEVAYLDHLLGGLLDQLDNPELRQNTAVIIAADHGEMLGEHRLMGHGFGVNEELVRVPLMVRLPGRTNGLRIDSPVTTTQIFHTLLDLAGIRDQKELEQREIQIERSSLRRFETQTDSSPVFSEAYPPENVIRIMEKKGSALLEEFSSRAVFRAVYQTSLEKLVSIGSETYQLFHLQEDPQEIHPLKFADFASKFPQVADLEWFIQSARLRQPQNWTRSKVSITDPQVLKRLQKLGYLD